MSGANPDARARYLVYDDAGHSIGEWPFVVSAAFAIGPRGPDQATVTLPKYLNDGTLNPWLHHTRLMPGGKGALIEIDARATGVPTVFLGRAKTVPDASDAQALTVTIQGPHSWLERETVPAQRVRKAAPGPVLRDIVGTHRGSLRLDVGEFHEGLGIDVDLNGGGFWSTVTGLEDMTGDRFYAEAIPGRCRLVANWYTQLADRFDRRGEPALEDGVNCTFSSDNDLDPDLPTLVLVGQSFDSGTGLQAVVKSAPQGALVGRQAALSAVIASGVVPALGGQGGQEVRADLFTKSALEAAADTMLRRGLVAIAMQTYRLTDLDRRAAVGVGDILRVRNSRDALGLFRSALGQVQAITYGIEPEVTCDVTIELWAMLEGGD